MPRSVGARPLPGPFNACPGHPAALLAEPLTRFGIFAKFIGIDEK
jgi:hypothetical protein